MSLQTDIGQWTAFVKAHEKVLLAIVLCLTLIHFGDKAYSAYGDRLKAAAHADQQKIDQLQKSNAKLESDLAALKAAVDARAQIDNQKIVAAKNTIVVRQKQDAALPLPELARHWNVDLLHLPPASITPSTNGNLSVSTDAAHATVNELEKVQPLEEQLVATNDKLQGCTDVRTKQDADIAGLKSTLAEVQHARVDDAKQAKHDQRAAYLKGLKHGIVIGVVATVAATVAILH